MKFVKTLLSLVLAVASFMTAQQPQMPIPVYQVNAKAVNGVAPGFAPLPPTSGLVLTIGPGTSNCNNTLNYYHGGTFTLTNSVANYIYLLDPWW